MKALFLLGVPGSGKDQLLRFVSESQKSHSLIEVQLERLYTAARAAQNLPELTDFPNIIVNGNAEHRATVIACKRVLEAMGYQTAVLYVYATNEASKARNDARMARGAKTFSEQQRQKKYIAALAFMQEYTKAFSPFWLYDNSGDISTLTEEMQGWLFELDQGVTAFMERAKPTSESNKYSSLNRAFETYTATAVDNSQGNTNVAPNGSPTENPATVMAKVRKLSKMNPRNAAGVRVPDQNRADPPVWEAMHVNYVVDHDKVARDKAKAVLAAAPDDKGDKSGKNTTKKGATAPPNFLDSKMGMVPSGSLGITSSYKPVGKPLSELRKRMQRK